MNRIQKINKILSLKNDFKRNVKILYYDDEEIIIKIGKKIYTK
jgi:hypothetical protein